MVPPGHPCIFPLVFFFVLLLSLFLPFSVFPLPSLFFVSSFCHFPLVSRIAFFAFLFASMLYLVAGSVLLSQWYTPPRCVRAFKSAYSPCCVLLSLYLNNGVLAFYYWFFFFFTSLPFFRFRFWTSFVYTTTGTYWYSSCLLGFGYCCCAVWSVATRMMPGGISDRYVRALILLFYISSDTICVTSSPRIHYLSSVFWTFCLVVV